MPTERNRLIRQRAYSLWEADGSPEGREWDYWLRAERDLDTEVQKPKRDAKGAVKTSPARPAKAGSSSKTAAKPTAAAKRTSSKRPPAAKS
jgi:hypothetical protein